MHLADLCDVGESVMHPARYYHNNLVGSLNLLKGMLDQGIRSIIFSSSCAIYGVPGALPIPETEAKVPITPYGVRAILRADLVKPGIELQVDIFGEMYPAVVQGGNGLYDPTHSRLKS